MSGYVSENICIPYKNLLISIYMNFLEYQIKGFLLSDLRIPFRWFSTVEIKNTSYMVFCSRNLEYHLYGFPP